jgi:hypothetical protein
MNLINKRDCRASGHRNGDLSLKFLEKWKTILFDGRKFTTNALKAEGSAGQAEGGASSVAATWGWHVLPMNQLRRGGEFESWLVSRAGL